MTPTDDDYDDVHHALGRPAPGRGVENTYRNHYCCKADGETAKRFEALDWWDFSHTINEGRDAIYRVNKKGRDALAVRLEPAST